MTLHILLAFFMHTSSVPDSLPPLHTLADDSIDKVNPSFEDDVIEVRMKNGAVLKYFHEDWDLEDENPKTSKRIREAIHDNTKTFTKVEQPAKYPGGDTAWQSYINDFCQRHKKEIKRAGKGALFVQFIVHMKGQLREIEIISEGASSAMTKLALQAVQESIPWIPAVQNGRKVISYQKARVNLVL